MIELNPQSVMTLDEIKRSSSRVVAMAQSVCDKENILVAFEMRKKHPPNSKEYKALSKFISTLVKERRREAKNHGFTL